MLVDIAQLCLIFTMLLGLVYAVVLLVSAHKQQQNLLFVMKPGASIQWLLLFLPYVVLTYSFITHDFSVHYVAKHSTLDQPLLYRISAVWGAHEGSLLLWVLIQASWTLAICLFGSTIERYFLARIVAILSFINSGIISFLLLTSNPLSRVNPQHVAPRELNPLLQDPSLALHPPLLYIGYIGFSIAFAFAVAVLLSGQFHNQWAKWLKPWNLTAWVFLTLGITMGSFWAYYELGWGGWWFWDPVENASLMPWLMATALIHSLHVSEKRQTFIGWSLLLAISTFSLSLLGTFLVRSGIITSVHSFAHDPEKGIYILSFIALTVGISLLLYAFRSNQLKPHYSFAFISRETGLVFSSFFLAIFAFTVLLGTLFPLLFELFSLGKISVGAPYFNSLFVWLMAPFALLLGFGNALAWRVTKLRGLLTSYMMIAILSLVLTLTTYWPHLANFSFTALIGLSLSMWISLATLWQIKQRVYQRHEWQWIQPRRFWGMHIAHLSIAVFVFGVTNVSHFSMEKHLVMQPGDSHILNNVSFHFNSVSIVEMDNFVAQQGNFVIDEGDGKRYSLTPQKRFYQSSEQAMTEASISSNLFRDLYVSLGEPQTENIEGPWSIRLYYKSSIACIWLAGILMAIGGLLSASDKRYRQNLA